jgi:hypothetical protein
MTKDEREKLRGCTVYASRILDYSSMWYATFSIDTLLDYCDKLEERVGKLEEALNEIRTTRHSFVASRYSHGCIHQFQADDALQALAQDDEGV